MARFVDLTPRAGAGLAAAFEEATHGLVVTGVTLSVARDGDRFVLRLVSHGPRTADENRGRIGMVEARGLDAEEIAEAVTAARGALRDLEIRVHLPTWTSSSFDARAAEVRRLVPSAEPVRVEVSRGVPTSERGEEPTGQAGVRLVLRFDGDVIVIVELEMAFTGSRDHVAVGADFANRATALATTLGVPIELAD